MSRQNAEIINKANLDSAARKKKVSRWNSGVCSICGEWVECITQEHAKKHGFKNADEMAQKGIVK